MLPSARDTSQRNLRLSRKSGTKPTGYEKGKEEKGEDEEEEEEEGNGVERRGRRGEMRKREEEIQRSLNKICFKSQQRRVYGDFRGEKKARDYLVNAGPWLEQENAGY